MLQRKVASGVEIKFSTCVEETYTSLSPVAWRDGGVCGGGGVSGCELLARASAATEKHRHRREA